MKTANYSTAAEYYSQVKPNTIAADMQANNEASVRGVESMPLLEDLYMKTHLQVQQKPCICDESRPHSEENQIKWNMRKVSGKMASDKREGMRHSCTLMSSDHPWGGVDASSYQEWLASLQQQYQAQGKV